MKTLYIIGNGFDLYHGLDTSYHSFAKYLSNKDTDLYDHLLNYFPLPDITEGSPTSEDKAQWNNFEQALADLDFESVLDDNSDLMANPGAEDFSEKDWYAFSFEMQEIVIKLTQTLIEHFNDFILNVEISKCTTKKLLDLDSKGYFLNFNYTETLQKVYDIPEAQITHIHNKATNEKVSLVLGHCFDASEHDDKRHVPPQGLNEESLQEWQEQISDNYDFSFESGRTEILSYFSESFKNTDLIIDDNEVFFDSLGEVEQIIVLGHSMSKVDIRYFEKIIEKTGLNFKWVVSYYHAAEKVEHFEILSRLGVTKSNIGQICLNDIKIKKQIICV